MGYDVFICHASEDKKDFVEQLAAQLQLRGLSIWYDDFTLKIGDGLRESIDRGLRDSSYGVVVLSPNFFKKKWTKRELDGLVAREDETNKIILPIWHNIEEDEVRNFSPTLANKLAVSSNEGIDAVVRKILEVVKPDLIKQKANVVTYLIELNSQYMLMINNINHTVLTQKEFKDVLNLSQQMTKAFSDAFRGLANAKDLDEIDINLKTLFKTIEDKLDGFRIYCVKCRRLVPIQKFEQVTMKNGKPAVKAKCPNCGTPMFKIGAK